MEDILQLPGEVEIINLALVSFAQSKYVNLQDYLSELNIYESIFNPVLSGTLTLSDSRNLVQEFAFVGDEYLIMTIKTPGLDVDYSISKAFKLYGLQNKSYVNDGSTLLYQLNFSSIEQFNDLANPIYRSFEGKPEDIITQIFVDYLQADRNVTIEGEIPTEIKSPLTILSESDNTINFVSPGWTPVQCINWIASKTLPKNNKAANFLFWETTKGFYFGSMDSIYENPEAITTGEYVFSQSYINSLKSDERSKSMFAIKSLRIDKTYDQLENNMSGYLSNRLIDVDLYNKKYENVDYDHGANFKNYSHSVQQNPVPLFSADIVRNPLAYTEINYKHSKLYDQNESNFDTNTKHIFGNRRSNMLELQNFSMEVVIPGRTDIEVGTIINIKMPKKTPGALTSEDKNDYKDDMLYSGYYLITSMNHKINLKTHYITMTVVRDSFASKEMTE